MDAVPDLTEIFKHLPVMLQWAWAFGTIIVVVVVGLNRIKKDPEPHHSTPMYGIDPFQYAMATCDRVERDMHGRFDRMERALRDINEDTIDTRRDIKLVLDRLSS